jgi:transglutaminase-like putative cysteine protease
LSFDTFFRAASYGTVACGALGLAASGGMGAGLAVAFVLVLVGAWVSEGRRWQLSERTGLVVVLLSMPLFYLDWKFQGGAGVGSERAQVAVSALVHLTLFLSSVKLFQIKADRDWLFLYLISFFEILLAAGLSISPLFMLMLGLYMFSALLTIVSFELRRAHRRVPAGEVRLLVAHEATLMSRLWNRRRWGGARMLRRLPLAALCLLILIFALALPIFFITPRFGSSAMTIAGGGATGYVGFSDRVSLGEIGRLQQNDRIVMRVRVDDPQAERNRDLRWRGVALDEFSGREWKRSIRNSDAVPRSERDRYQFGTTTHLEHLTTQTFFLEPIDTPVLFAAPRTLALQGALPFVRRDKEGALTTSLHLQERLTYRAYSDTVEPPAEILRRDVAVYPQEMRRYLQRPENLDPRIEQLAGAVVERYGAANVYDKARAIEDHLNNAYGYTLEMRAGGSDPLADFLFRVRAGHCEYFSTAMAVMLRTQGIAARVVNGFQMGEYNDAADAYTVRQKNAHSWVEVYFPKADAWVTFDPTPPAGRTLTTESGGLRAQLNKYAEALELFWIQYVVAYDRQEQRTLAGALRRRWSEYRQLAGLNLDALAATIRSWWEGSPEDAGGAKSLSRTSRIALLLFACALTFALLVYGRRLWRKGFNRRLTHGEEVDRSGSIVAFYQRMLEALEARGLRRAAHQTPLEFAAATGIPEALSLTRAYHRVRYGKEKLSTTEVAEVEEYLRRVEEKNS